MENIEACIISKHTIKPSASTSLLRPYKLSLLDQLTPALYIPIILFYPITIHDFNLHQTLADLREALSQTLTLYYPFSGRVKNNLYIDDFEAGVPYQEARVKCDMKDFLWHPKIECLEKFIALKPFSMEVVSDGAYPLLGVQVNVFDSGLAIGICTSHKIIDGATVNGFLKSWGAVFGHLRDKIINPNLSEPALLFPPRDDLPEKEATFMEGLWVSGRQCAKRRFVFDAKAIARIQDEAKSEHVPKPSRVQSVIGFLWKHMGAASQRVRGSDTTSTRTSIAAQAVNIRSRMKMDTPLDDNAIGNLMLWAPAELELNHEAQDTNNPKLCDLVGLLTKSVKKIDSDYVKTFTGEEGYKSMFEYQEMLRKMSCKEPAPEIYLFSSWTTFYGELDFGWGKSSFIGLSGKIESEFCNFTILVPTKCNTGIEAWVNLDEEKMALLEVDPQFLATVYPKPLIISRC